MDAAAQLKKLIANCSEVISEAELHAKLKRSLAAKKPLIIKAGFDPSAPDIHLGHTVLLNKLRQFQEAGHTVVFIIGDATARIGDPSGRSQTRPVLTPEEIKTNARTYAAQAFKVLDRKKTRTVFNSEWFRRLGFAEMMDLVARVTVRQIIDRDDFQKRLTAGQPVSLMELFYPLMQAYDSVRIRADVEIGGTDQKFNLLLGRELQKSHGLEPQAIITLPLLVGLDGNQKMSKSLNNHVGVSDPPEEIYGRLMSLPDESMPAYYDLLTDESGAGVRARIQSGALHPKEAKGRLAFLLTERFHGEKAARKAGEAFDKIFSRREYPEEAAVIKLPSGELSLVRLLTDCGMASSANEARRLIRQDAVTLNGSKVNDPRARVTVGTAEQQLKVGKRRFARFVAGPA